MQPTTFPYWATWQHISGVVRGGMTATSRPWTTWQGWADAADRNSRRRVRLSLHDISDLRDLKVDWSRLPRPEITFYTPNQIRHLIRFDSSLGHALPTSGWLPAQPRDPVTQWRLADIAHYQLPPPAASPAPASHHAWLEGVARGLPLGAVALVLLLLLVRVADKCKYGSFFRRRRSSARPTADVSATTNMATATAIADNSEPPPAPTSAPDPPPPYSEVTRGNVPLPRKAEDPPPPYNSACYVSYSNPQTGMPTVHFYNNLFGTPSQTNRLQRANRDLHIYGFNLDTGQTQRSANSEGRALVFDNGRVVERANPRQLVYDQNSHSDNSSDDSNGNNGSRKTRSNRGVFIA